MKQLLLFILSLGFLSNGFSQNSLETKDYCNHEINLVRLIKENSNLFSEYQKRLEEAQKFISSGKKAPKVDLTMPVVFHIIHENGLENITDDQCIEQVKQLNEDFNANHPNMDLIVDEFKSIAANIGLNFTLARKDPQGNSSSGIERHYVSGGSTQYNGYDGSMKSTYGWPSNMYLNIYVVRQADYGSPNYPVGYGSGWASPNSGTVCSYWAIGRTRTASPTHHGLVTHELGHYFNLQHVFGAGCSNGDGIPDTPPTNGAHNSANGDCDLKYECNGVLTNVQNFMDYSHCQVMFTEGQKAVILNITNGNYASLTSATNLNDVGIIGEPVSAQFWGNYNHIPPKNPIKFTDFSVAESGNIETYSWEFPGGIPSTFTGQIPPEIVYETAGQFNVKLTVTNNNGDTDVEEKNNYVTVQNDIVIRDGDFKVTNGKFWDPGYTGDYGVRTHQTMTMRPTAPNKAIQVTFESFKMEANCNFDYLEIYDGASINSTLIGKFCGADNPGTIISSAASGALTFSFGSNSDGRFPGWEANYETIELIASAPIADFKSTDPISCNETTITFNDKSSGIPTSWEWVFEGGVPSSFSGEGPVDVTYDVQGVYQVSLTVQNNLGTDIEEKVDYISIGIGSNSTPFKEGFEGSYSLDRWTIENPDNEITWELSVGIGNNSSNSIIMNNGDYSDLGQKDAFTSTGIDLTKYQSPALKFDIAYIPFNKTSKDELRVFSSIDCGENWTEIYYKDNLELETIYIPNNGTVGNWIPFQNEHWRTETIDLSSIKNNRFVLLKFENTTGYGNPIWVDNIQINNFNSVANSLPSSLNVYPNPSKGKFTLQSIGLTGSEYNVYSISGSLIKTGRISGNSSTIDLSNTPPSIYLLTILTNKEMIHKKLILE